MPPIFMLLQLLGSPVGQQIMAHPMGQQMLSGFFSSLFGGGGSSGMYGNMGGGNAPAGTSPQPAGPPEQPGGAGGVHTQPIRRSPGDSTTMLGGGGGTPSLQGFRGASSMLRSPNQGGYSGPGLNEMNMPGLSFMSQLSPGLFGGRGTGIGALAPAA